MYLSRHRSITTSPHHDIPPFHRAATGGGIVSFVNLGTISSRMAS